MNHSHEPSFDERDVTESRPNPAAAYHCGLSGIGKSCALGPTPSGRCCQEQWVVKCGDHACAKACQGAGKCEVGQLKHTGCEEDRQDFLPCIPIKNSWYSRNTLALNLALLSGGLLLVCLALPYTETLFAPGSLSTSHLQILGNKMGAARCSTCHPNSHTSSSNQTQEQLCMNCHQAHMKQAIHGFPHDVPAKHFAQLVSKRLAKESQYPQGNSVSIHSEDFADPHWRGIQTKCAQCHQEHHGDSRSLQDITDARCQSCHQRQFASFSDGHPEFRQLPQVQPRRIAFDHQAHLELYFPRNNTTFDCSQCHQSGIDRRANVVKTVGFDKACARCHDNSLRASAAEGWALLQVPSLNSNDMQIDGSRLTHWPTAALYGYDGPITLPMRLLLSSDTEVAAAIAHFPHGDLSKVDLSDPDQQAAARTIAAAVRNLLIETAEQGQAAWERRLTDMATQTLGRTLVVAEKKLIQSMVSGLPPDLFRQAASNWFRGHDGVVLDTRLHVIASLVSIQEGSPRNDSLLVGDSENLLDVSSDNLLDSGSADLLGDEDADTLLRGSSTQAIQPNQPHGKGHWNVGEDAESLATPSREGLNKTDANRKHLVGLQHLSQGGWFLDSRTLSVRYMMRGHADPVMTAWIQFATLIESAAQKNYSHTAIGSNQTFHSQLSVGQCMECHLLPEASSRTISANDWLSMERDQGRRFTHFDHRPHLTLAGNTNCQTCHQLDESRKQRLSAVKSQLKSDSPGDRRSYLESALVYFQTEFRSIQKSQCNACHRPGGAPEGCTQCHNYHVDLVTVENDMSSIR